MYKGSCSIILILYVVWISIHYWKLLRVRDTHSTAPSIAVLCEFVLQRKQQHSDIARSLREWVLSCGLKFEVPGFRVN